MRKYTPWLLAALAALWAPSSAPAQETPRGTITLAICDATTPFESTQARLEFVHALAVHLENATGTKMSAKVFARTEDFQQALRRGEIQYAVLGAPYVVGLGATYPVLGVATRGGATTGAWEVIAQKPIHSLGDLRGQTVVMPRVGARDTAFLTNVLFEGEVGDEWFGKISNAPDPLSVVAAVGVGRAGAGVVPAGLPLPAGVSRGMALRAVSWPLVVALPGTQAGLNERVAAALPAFKKSSAALSGFARADGEVTALSRAMGRAELRGPMAVPPPQLDVRGLLTGRTFKIERPELARFATATASSK